MSNLATTYWHRMRELEKDVAEERRRSMRLEASLAERDVLILQMQETIKTLQEEVQKLKGTGRKLKNILFREGKKAEGGHDSKRGAKDGHGAAFRRRPSDAEVTATTEVRLTQCPHCATPLDPDRPQGWTERIVTDIPLPIETIITRYQIARYHCGHCGKWVQGLPAGTLPRSPFGIHIMMLVLHVKYRGKNTDTFVLEHLRSCYGLSISKGAIHGLLEKAAVLFGPSYEAIKQAIREGKVVQADETGWRVEGQQWQAWAFLNEKAVYFTIENTRGSGVPEKELAGFRGQLVTDALQSYNSVAGAERQLCLVHFLRHTKDIAETDGASGEARWFHAQMKWFVRIARRKHRHCRSDDERLALHEQMTRVLERFWKNRTYQDPLVEKTRAWWLEKRSDQLLTFLKYTDVPWHNNAAERAIRPFVTRRKVSGGSRSERGAEREAINFSCIATLLKQEKDLFTEIPQLFAAAIAARQLADSQKPG